MEANRRNAKREKIEGDFTIEDLKEFKETLDQKKSDIERREKDIDEREKTISKMMQATKRMNAELETYKIERSMISKEKGEI